MRREITQKSHWWFFHVFLSHYIQYSIAPFHQEMFKVGEQDHKLVVIMAFRGSGKSTIFNLSYALWSILGVKQKKCVLIISKTKDQVATHLRNIKYELEYNKLLRDDLGPFKDESEKFGILSLVLPHMGARIIGISREQSIRGIRHGPNRPDLIICDDVEDSASVEKFEERNDTFRWFKDEVITVGDKNTTIVMLGNLLHKDSLLMRLWKQIADKEVVGVFRAYPIIDNRGGALWPGKFEPVDIGELQKSIANPQTWKQEYLLVLPYDRIYDKPENKTHLIFFLKFLEDWRKIIGDSIYSKFLRRKGFRLCAPYGEREFGAIEDLLHQELQRRNMEEEEKRKSRPPTPAEIRAEKENEATRLRSPNHNDEYGNSFLAEGQQLYREKSVQEQEYERIRRHALEIDE